MKTMAIGTLLITLMTLGGIFLPGCAGYRAAQQAYEESITDANKIAEEGAKIAEELKAIYADLDRIYAEYELALKNGDKTKAEALLRAGTDALKLAASKKQLLEDAKKAFEQAKDFVTKAQKRAADAKSTEEYIGNIFGTIAGALGGIFGVGGIGAAFMKNREAKQADADYNVLASAAKKTAVNVDEFVPEEKWQDFLAAQNKAMSSAEIAEMDFARKGAA